ncbi:hypothetical protein C8R45DRAFT_1218809 [Mycena sanguinolenta]|nr:hypothetical protein C8R45DRAFT_1218809 [Mycena sanguinolenta]
MSTFALTSDQEVAEYSSMKRIDDATDILSENVEPSRVCRRMSSNLFGGFSSFGTGIDAPFGSLRGSFSFGASDFQWGAVQPELPVPATQGQSLQRTGSFAHGFLNRNDSIASNFTSMTDDELSDEVSPWAIATDSRFDFGFSSALREACVYNVPPQFLPSDEYRDTEDESESETVIDTDTGEEVDTDEEVDDDDDDVSDTETVCADDPASPVEEIHELDFPHAPTTPSDPEFSISSWRPDAMGAADFPAHLLADSPRRSARIARPSRAKLESDEQSQSPTKRKRVPDSRTATPSKKVRVAGKAKKPVSRAQKKAARPAASEVRAVKRRVILRV